MAGRNFYRFASGRGRIMSGITPEKAIAAFPFKSVMTTFAANGSLDDTPQNGGVNPNNPLISVAFNIDTITRQSKGIYRVRVDQYTAKDYQGDDKSLLIDAVWSLDISSDNSDAAGGEIVVKSAQFSAVEGGAFPDWFEVAVYYSFLEGSGNNKTIVQELVDLSDSDAVSIIGLINLGADQPGEPTL